MCASRLETHSQERGFLLISLLFITFLIAITMTATMQVVVQYNNASFQDTSKLKSQLAADAGADYAIDQIYSYGDWLGTSGEVELSNDSSGKTTYEVTVDTSPDGTYKTLTVVGRIYIPASSLTAKSSSEIEIGLKGSGSLGLDGTSAYLGIGSLIMEGSAKISDGEVYAGGTITMSGSARIGSSSHPVNVNVAHNSCPTGGGAGYPRVCNPGENGEPINIPNWATFIYGEVKANNQSDGSGMSNPGLVAGSVTPGGMPSHDRAGIIDDINASGLTQTGAAASCSGTTQKTWPANLKITGNVTIGNSCKLTVAGNVWITGNLTVNGASQFIVQDGLASPAHVIVDGSGGFVLDGSAVLTPNSSDTGFRIVTYYSYDSCSVSEDGCEVTGTNLYNSQSYRTIWIKGSGNAQKTMFYARWTRAQLDGSSQVGAIVGQSLKLTGVAEIKSGVEFTPGEEGEFFWAVDTFKKVY